MKQKISFNYISPEYSLEVQEIYTLQDFKIVRLKDFGGIFVCFCSFSTTKEIEELWKKINGILASYLTKYFETDFQKWNVYFFLATRKKTSASLQYKIENDTFFCRKIVIQTNYLDFDNESIINLINNHIINGDIKNSQPNDSIYTEYNSESIIYSLLCCRNIEKGKDQTKVIYDEIYKSLAEKRHEK